jgi:hypothetical protein
VTTLTYNTTTITLPTDLLWVDEFDWSPVEYVSRYSVTGALLVNSGLKLTGRPITLLAGQSWGWVNRTTALAVQTLAALQSPALVLVYRGTTYQVTWATQGTPFVATPLVDFSNPQAESRYILNLRFITRA